MCLIIDVNVLPNALNGEDQDYKPIYDALFEGAIPPATMVYGGKLTEEYRLCGQLFRLILRLDQAGRARQVPSGEVDAECQRITELDLCNSNDQHIIALARVSGVRLVCTDDNALMADFTNKDILSAPRGKVYRDSSHRRLIVAACK